MTPTGATIGKSIQVKGELTGSEDLAIEGKVEGKITLNGCRVTIGPSAQVTAEITAKSVVVGGQLKGSIRAEERVEISATGTLFGDVRAPRVVLVDGAKFKGSVDMDASTGTGSSAGASTSTKATATATATAPVVRDETPAYAGAKQS
jgi:cytoskeletal protein CcmA (bactofilin family)